MVVSRRRFEAASRRVVSIGFAGCLLLTAHGQSAAKALERSMQREFPVNVDAVFSQRDPKGNGRLRVKLLRDKVGRLDKRILSPLHMAGIRSIDDGDRSLSIWPDERLVIDQASPLRIPCDADFRIDLARRNYVLKVEGHPTIAGRKTLRVVATPRHRELCTRRFYIDAETYYPLRVDVVTPGGTTTTEFNVLEIRYPKELPSDAFVPPATSGMRRIRYDRPTAISASVAQEKIGFAPILPDGLPMGFKVQEMQINDTPDWRSLAVRLTDGLSRATVYEFRRTDEPVRAMEDSTFRDLGPVRLLLVSEIAEPVRVRLLNAFIALAGEVDLLPDLQMDAAPFGRLSGTVRPFQTLAKVETPILSPTREGVVQAALASLGNSLLPEPERKQDH